MIKSETSRYGKTLYIIYPGDYVAVREDCVMASVAGSSVIVCLYDVQRRIGAMGNFIVPGSLGTEGIYADDIARHGIQNMELMIGEVVKKGGDRRYLKSKLFGAAKITNSLMNSEEISKSNIKFLHEYFAFEKIPIVSEDLGGNFRRKILFFPINGTVLRRFQKRNEDSSEFRVIEKEYIDSVFRNKERSGRLILFE